MKKDNKIITLVVSMILVLGLGFWFGWSYLGSSRDTVSSATRTPLPGFYGERTPTPDSLASSTPQVSKTPAPISLPTKLPGKIIKAEVPFTSQAPFGDWSDPRYQDGCEEASALMAVYWARGISGITAQTASDQIIGMSDWEQMSYGSFHDTSAQDTVDRIFKQYFNHKNVKVLNGVSAGDIINELEKENLVVIPADGQALRNPFFTSPGPERHMLVIIGYDYGTQEFITNDPGTRSGRDYRYDKNILFNAIRDYPSGYHEPIIGINKNIIVVSK
ncbi:MAG: C39 family peptidase [bacterium]|nr:C39 family peptidase [bacterium]